MDTIGVRTITVPALRGKHYADGDDRYRVWAHDSGLDFHALPPYADGGPAMVVLGAWCKSVQSGADTDGHELKIFRPGADGGYEYHSLHGTRYDSRDDANWAAYDAGVVGFMVYERDARRFGLPTEQS